MTRTPDEFQPTICANPEDCCRELSRVWAALGVGYNGKSASENVADLKSALAVSQREREQLREALISRSRQVHRLERDRTGAFVGIHGSWMGRCYDWEECPSGPCCNDRKLLNALSSPASLSPGEQDK